MHKGVTYEEMKYWVTRAREKGVQINAQIILGHPGETRESLERTIYRASTELNFGSVTASIVVVYPGTALWDMVERGDHGASWAPGMKHNWDAYTRRSVMIRLPGVDEECLHEARERLANSVADEWAGNGIKAFLWQSYKSAAWLRRIRFLLASVRMAVIFRWYWSRRRWTHSVRSSPVMRRRHKPSNKRV